MDKDQTDINELWYKFLNLLKDYYKERYESTYKMYRYWVHVSWVLMFIIGLLGGIIFRILF